MISLLNQYQSGVDDIDDIFKISKIIKDAVLANLSGLNLSNQNVTYDIKKTIENTKLMISGLDSSIESAEKSRINKLYAQGIVLVVSLAEELLKVAFEDLVNQHLEDISCIRSKEILISEISKRKFNLSRQDWVDIILAKIYDNKNPEEKINFQNIKSIEGIFQSYFNITVGIEKIYEQRIHQYFQIRHIILHNNSRIDQRFIFNLQKAEISVDDYKQGEKISINREDYLDCKETFKNFFITLEAAMIKSADGRSD